ncbi:acyl-CoA transferase [Afipia sp. P52-10]|uniref:CaiB/BaiF CoA transferase family protein n=1 Tax=Afipia sp. P52-10 TaxID=1429916 RepID=UPI0003DF29F9|nr:CoA transferase [Afipia sp. P52-10]ETR76109.1 acyl-CoA transferase [Afipia sp. P52-10]
MTPFQPDASGPLQGVVVLDLSRLVAGNMLSLQLADFGAEVIKVEDPGKGDPLRDWKIAGKSFFWKAYARNKKSLTLDLRKEQGRKLLRALVDQAHVLIENYRPGTLEKMGIGPDVLQTSNPKLIVVRISGWGQTGPYAGKPGFGTLVEGMSGFAAKTGFADREPVLPPTALADMIAGLYGMAATMTALREVEVKGGKGQVIDLSLLEAMHSVVGADAAGYRATGHMPKRLGSRSNTASPRNVFKTRDGRWISVSGSMQSMAERLYTMIGRADMIKDPRFATNSARLANTDEAEKPIREYIASKDFDECLALFENAEVTAAPVYDIDQFVDDVHVREREVVIEVPDEEVGQVTMHNILPRLSVTPGVLRLPAPALGQHTAEILARIGVGEDALEKFAAEGII